MNKTELLESLVETTGVGKSQVKKVIDGLIDTIAEALQENEDIAIRRFGTFSWEEVELNGFLEEQVTLRVSPIFNKRCQKECEEDEESAELKTLEAELFTRLRELLGKPPSESTWSRITTCFAEWPESSPGRAIALEYAQTHLDNDAGWLAFPTKGLTAQGNTTPKYISKDTAAQAQSENPSTPALGAATPNKNGAYVHELQKGQEKVLRMVDINQRIARLKKANIADFMQAVTAFADPSELAVTGTSIHAAGWRPQETNKMAIYIKQLQSIEKAEGLEKLGLSLLFVRYDGSDGWFNGKNEEGFHSYDSAVLIASQDGTYIEMTVEGSFTIDYGWEGSEGHTIQNPVFLSLDGKPFWENFDLDEDEDEDERITTLTAGHATDRLAFYSAELFDHLRSTFPSIWEESKEYPTDTRERYRKVPKAVTALMRRCISYFAPDPRYPY